MSFETLHLRSLINNETLPGASESRNSILIKIAGEEKAFRDAINSDVQFEQVKMIRVRINKLTLQLNAFKE